jgi:hypothetical protein
MMRLRPRPAKHKHRFVMSVAVYDPLPGHQKLRYSAMFYDLVRCSSGCVEATNISLARGQRSSSRDMGLAPGPNERIERKTNGF